MIDRLCAHGREDAACESTRQLTSLAHDLPAVYTFQSLHRDGAVEMLGFSRHPFPPFGIMSTGTLSCRCSPFSSRRSPPGPEFHGHQVVKSRDPDMDAGGRGTEQPCTCTWRRTGIPAAQKVPSPLAPWRSTAVATVMLAADARLFPGGARQHGGRPGLQAEIVGSMQPAPHRGVLGSEQEFKQKFQHCTYCTFYLGVLTPTTSRRPHVYFSFGP